MHRKLSRYLGPRQRFIKQLLHHVVQNWHCCFEQPGCSQRGEQEVPLAHGLAKIRILDPVRPEEDPEE